MASQTLRAHIQNLPQELFDDIYELVFTPTSTIVDINRDYRPPVQLQVSKASRESFADRYYGNTTFTLHSELEHRWGSSLTSKHFQIVRFMQCTLNSDEVAKVSASATDKELMQLAKVSSLVCFVFAHDYRIWDRFYVGASTVRATNSSEEEEVLWNVALEKDRFVFVKTQPRVQEKVASQSEERLSEADHQD